MSWIEQRQFRLHPFRLRGSLPVMDAVDDAMRATPREGFLPPSERRLAAYEGPLDIGHGQTNSQPLTVAAMLRLLDVRPGQRVLDVGSGSGWTTALLAHLVGADGQVVGVERVPGLAQWGAANVAATGRTWARVRVAEPGVLGDPGGAPWDRILVSADAAHLPPELVAQLGAEGVLVIPVRGRMLRVRADGSFTRHGLYRFVPLIKD